MHQFSNLRCNPIGTCMTTRSKDYMGFATDCLLILAMLGSTCHQPYCGYLTSYFPLIPRRQRPLVYRDKIGSYLSWPKHTYVRTTINTREQSAGKASFQQQKNMEISPSYKLYQHACIFASFGCPIYTCTYLKLRALLADSCMLPNIDDLPHQHHICLLATISQGQQQMLFIYM